MKRRTYILPPESATMQQVHEAHMTLDQHRRSPLVILPPGWDVQVVAVHRRPKCWPSMVAQRGARRTIRSISASERRDRAALRTWC